MGTPIQEYYHRRIVDALYYLKFELNQPITDSSWIERWAAREGRREILRMVRMGYRHFERTETYLYVDTVKLLESPKKRARIQRWAASYHGQPIKNIIFYDAVLYMAYLGLIPPHNYQYIDAPVVSAVGFSSKEWEEALATTRQLQSNMKRLCVCKTILFDSFSKPYVDNCVTTYGE